MIEVNLFSVSTADYNTTVGKCVSRSRFDSSSMGVGILEFVKGFLRDNLDNLESAISNSDLVDFINNSEFLSKDTTTSKNDVSTKIEDLKSPSTSFLVEIIGVVY